MLANRYSQPFGVDILPVVDTFNGMRPPLLNLIGDLNEISGVPYTDFTNPSRWGSIAIIDAIDNLKGRYEIHRIISPTNDGVVMLRSGDMVYNMHWFSVGNTRYTGQVIWSASAPRMATFYGTYILNSVFAGDVMNYYRYAQDVERLFNADLEGAALMTISRMHTKLEQAYERLSAVITSTERTNILKSVVDIFPEQFDTISMGIEEESEISCALNAIQEPQNMAINSMAASAALEMIYGAIFGSINYDAYFFSMKSTSKKVPIGENVATYEAPCNINPFAVSPLYSTKTIREALRGIRDRMMELQEIARNTETQRVNVREAIDAAIRRAIEQGANENGEDDGADR